MADDHLSSAPALPCSRCLEKSEDRLCSRFAWKVGYCKHTQVGAACNIRDGVWLTISPVTREAFEVFFAAVVGDTVTVPR